MIHPVWSCHENEANLNRTLRATETFTRWKSKRIISRWRTIMQKPLHRRGNVITLNDAVDGDGQRRAIIRSIIQPAGIINSGERNEFNVTCLSR